MGLPTLSVNLFGGFQIHCGETSLTDRFKPRLQTLTAYLLLHRNGALSRQKIAFHFWPDSTDAQARANLRKMVYRLRQIFPAVDDYLDLEGATLSWRAGVPLQLDVSDFETTLETAAREEISQKEVLLKVAVALYKGDLLPDLYDDWVLAARERLRQRYLYALQTLAKVHEQQRDYASAIPLVRQLLREDPLVEEAYRHLMRLQALSGDVAGALRTYHRCARQLEQELGVEPGKATQETYRRLLDRPEPLEPPPARRAARQVPLVGQEVAWQQLLEAWRLAAAGRPQAVVISGEAGIGKTRLAEELLSWTNRQGITTLTAACFPMETPLPLRPVTDWLRSQAVGRALPALAPRWRSEVARILPELLAADPELKMPRPMTEAWQQQHFFTALVEAVTIAGEPLLLFVDDLHWADADTLRWLHFLARQKGDRRFLLLATVRSEEVGRRHPLPAWQEGLERLVPVHEIELQPLSAEATASLASHLFGQGIDEETAAALHMETEGNPLFTVEMVRAGFPQQEAPLPDKVRSVIEIRLSKLTSQAREMAGLAAVIGRSFDFSTLAAASSQPEEAVLASLDELWQKQVVREQEEHGYDFTHDKIRQVALLQLSPARRRWWHGRLARALEDSSAAGLGNVHGQIAAHWEAAGHPQKAVGHYLEAARIASRLYAHEEVMGYLQRALSLLPENDARRTDIYAQMGEALLALGQFEEAAVNFQAAANRTEDVVKKVNLFAQHVRSLSGSRQFEEAKNIYRKALSLLGAPVAEPEERAWRTWIDLHLSLLNVLYFANERDEMEKVCEAMATPVEAHGTARQRAQYLASVSRMRCRILRYRMTDEDVAERRAALQWARETNDDTLIADHQFGLGFILLWAGYPEMASDELHQAAAQAEALGNVPLQSRCLTYLGIAYRMLGDESGARQTVEKMVPVARAEGNHYYLGVAEALRAWLMWRAQDPEAAERHSRVALRQWEAAIGPPYPMEWLARLPLIAVALARTDSTPHLSDAREQARALLVSPQQRLPDALAAALETAITADTPYVNITNLQEACRLAQEQGYL